MATWNRNHDPRAKKEDCDNCVKAADRAGTRNASSRETCNWNE